MLQRCTNPKHRSYDEYGGAGVLVHPRWRVFANFLEDMGERPSKSHTLGRSTPFSDYGPGECSWQNKSAQNKGLKDQSKDIVVSKGKVLTKSQWAEKAGIKYRSLLKRIQRAHRKGKTTDDVIRELAEKFD